MQKVINISGNEVGFKATALTPRLYRHWLGRDMIKDMNSLRKAYNKVNNLPKDATNEEKEEAQLSVLDLEIFENVAWVMARQYDTSIQCSADEWLDGFDMFSVYEIMPYILELWGKNERTTSVPKKQ